MNNSLTRQVIGEIIGMWVLGFFGLGAIAVSVTTGALDFYQCNFVFCFIVGLAVIYVAPLSGAWLNPAITLGAAVAGDMKVKNAITLIIAQIAGAFLGAMTLYLLYNPAIAAFEAANEIVRGTEASQLTSMIFCCYTPHPALAKSLGWDSSVFGNTAGLIAEFFGTFILAISVYAFNDPDNAMGPKRGKFGFMIGLVLLVYVAVIAPISMCAVNPARDLGPRIVAGISGWGKVAFSNPSGAGGSWWIYQIGPYLGGICGVLFWKKICRPIIEKNLKDAA